jgi:hypothetical protein
MGSNNTGGGVKQLLVIVKKLVVLFEELSFKMLDVLKIIKKEFTSGTTYYNTQGISRINCLIRKTAHLILRAAEM